MEIFISLRLKGVTFSVGISSSSGGDQSFLMMKESSNRLLTSLQFGVLQITVPYKDTCRPSLSRLVGDVST